jgi:hypothetical protein
MRLYRDQAVKTGAIKDASNFLSYLASPSYLPGLAGRNIRAAWEPSFAGTELPVAVLPSYVHQRMATQLSRFTIHGRLKSGFERLIRSDLLVKFTIDKRSVARLKKELLLLGITHSLVYPDLEGLSRQLKEQPPP